MIVTREQEQTQSEHAESPLYSKEYEREARHLLASDPDELIRRIMLIYSAYEDERAARDLAEKDSQQVREENGDLLEELTAERQAHEQTRQTLAMTERRYDDLDSRHTELYMKWEGRQKWREQLLANETIPNATCKLVGTYLWENGLENFDGELQFFKERIAADLGCDPGTVANAIARLKDYDVINVRTEDLILADGTKHRNALTYISRNTLVNPKSIAMEKKQGAAKPRICFNDDRPYDNWTVRHCPECREVQFYGQPGIPQTASRDVVVVDIIRQHKNLIPRALRDNEEKKPSSTTPTAIVEPTATTIDTQLDTTPFGNITSIDGKTHDSEEKKPSPTPLAPSNENDRWAAAEKILTELNEYGLALTYEGGRRLVETSTIKPSNAQIKNLAERIKLYETEIRTYLSMQADYDPQEAILLNTTLPEDQQISLEHKKLNAQRTSLPRTESFSEEGSHD